jgi:hypothetical protein
MSDGLSLYEEERPVQDLLMQTSGLSEGASLLPDTISSLPYSLTFQILCDPTLPEPEAHGVVSRSVSSLIPP